MNINWPLWERSFVAPKGDAKDFRRKNFKLYEISSMKKVSLQKKTNDLSFLFQVRISIDLPFTMLDSQFYSSHVSHKMKLTLT